MAHRFLHGLFILLRNLIQAEVNGLPNAPAQLRDFGGQPQGLKGRIPIQIHWPDCEIAPQLDPWPHLTILQYLAGAKGTPLTGRFVSLSDFREGGLARGSSFDRENDRIIGKIGKSDAAAIQEAAAKLGGTVIQGKADMTIRFSFFPNFPLVLNLWLEDEDFPASGKVLLDAAIESALQVEAAGTAAGILLAMLEEKLQK